MPRVVDYQYDPTPKQAFAHSVMADEILFGGSAGGGKSRAGRAEAVRMASLVPGSLTYVLRRTYKQLEQDVVPKFHIEMPRGLAKYNKSEHTWYFVNGSRIVLGHMENEEDVGNYLSSEPQLVVFEELTQFMETQYRQLRARLRASGAVLDRMNELGWICRSFSTTNPGSMGHQWVKTRFVDPGIRNRIWWPESTEDELDPGSRCFIPARLEDNPHMDPAYGRRLDNLEPVLRRAYRDGDWDILQGVRFTQFRRSAHVVDPEELPIELIGHPLAIGVDYGLSAPFAALWGALLPDGMLVIYRELYQAELTPSQQALMIAQSERPGERQMDRPIPLVLDPSMWARETANTARGSAGVAAFGSKAWVYGQQFPGQIVKANNDRLHGWSIIDELLRVRDDGEPRLKIYSTCTNLIRTLPALPRSKTNPEDVDTKAEDHAADALRYLACHLIKGGHMRVAPPLRAPRALSAAGSLASAQF